jgi:hypothetical protein
MLPIVGASRDSRLPRLLARWIDNSPRIQVPVGETYTLARKLLDFPPIQVYILCEPLSTLYMITLVRWVVHKNLEATSGERRRTQNRYSVRLQKPTHAQDGSTCGRCCRQPVRRIAGAHSDEDTPEFVAGALGCIRECDRRVTMCARCAQLTNASRHSKEHAQLQGHQ